ncbi:MAG: dockerin type I domain-containing protein [Planctomycetota bacterium]
MNSLRFGTVVMWAVALALSAGATEIHNVYPSGAIQDAIDAAESGDVVIVHVGVYTGVGNRDLDYLGKNITVRSTDPNNPEVVSETIVDCQQLGRGVIFQTGETNDARLLGLTIRNGLVEVLENDPEGYGGGAILCDGTAPTIEFNIVENSMARGIDHSARGGAILCWYCNDPEDPDAPQPIIRDNTISGNVSVLRIDGVDRGTGYGGAIACIESSPLIEHNWIENNLAGPAPIVALSGRLWSTFTYSASQGGGIYLYDNCTPVIDDNDIIDNTARLRTGPQDVGTGCTREAQGGGVYSSTVSSNEYDISPCNPTFINNRVIGNVAVVDAAYDCPCNEELNAQGGGYYGAAIYGDPMPFNDNFFSGNRAEVVTKQSHSLSDEVARAAGGAIYAGEHLEIDSNEIVANLATVEFVDADNDSMLAAYGGGIAANGNVHIHNNIIADNQAVAGLSADTTGEAPCIDFRDNNYIAMPACGGGIAAEDGAMNVLITDNIIVRNSATVSGSGDSLGGGVALAGGARAGIFGCTLAENSAAFGGGVGLSLTTMLGLQEGQDYRGLWNTILWNNTANTGTQVAAANSAHVYVRYCDIQYGQNGVFCDNLYWQTGNIEENPQFVYEGGNYHIRNSSLCINAGDTEDPFNPPADPYDDQTDIDGQSRVINDRIDIGADEFGVPFIYGDMNCDGNVDSYDIDPFILAVSSKEGYEQQYPNCRWLNGDVNGDGEVNSYDIVPFIDLL